MQTRSSQLIERATTTLDSTPRWEGLELNSGTLIGEGPEERTLRSGWARLELHERGDEYLLVRRPFGPGRIWTGAPTVEKITQLQAIKMFMEWFATERMTAAVASAFRGEARLNKSQGKAPSLEIRGGLARAIIGTAEAQGLTEEALLRKLLLGGDPVQTGH